MGIVKRVPRLMLATRVSSGAEGGRLHSASGGSIHVPAASSLARELKALNASEQAKPAIPASQEYAG